MPPALEKRLWFWCCLTQPWSRPHLGSYRGVCVHFTSTRGKPAYIKQDPFSVNSCLFLQFDPHNCPQFYFLQWKITGNNTVIFSYMSYRLLSSARKLLLTSVPSSLVCLSVVEMSMPHSFPAKSIRENLAYKIFFLLENGVEGSLALGCWQRSCLTCFMTSSHWWLLSDSPIIWIIFPCFYPFLPFHRVIQFINLDNQSCGQRARPDCPGTMWGPASAKLHTHHHVLAGYCHCTQVASMLVMDVLFMTRWGLRAKARWRSTCLPLLAPFSILSTVVLAEFPSAVPGRCTHPCAGSPEVPSWMCPNCPAVPSCGAVNTPWGSALPAPSSVSLLSHRGWWKGFGFQAANSCGFNHRWKDTKQASLERLPQPPEGCAAAGTHRV